MLSRRVCAYLVAALALVAIPGAHAQEYNTKGTIIYYDAAGNENLDPADAQAASSFSQEAMLALYDPLIRLQNSGEPGPGLAESWSVNADLTQEIRARDAARGSRRASLAPRATAEMKRRRSSRSPSSLSEFATSTSSS